MPISYYRNSCQPSNAEAKNKWDCIPKRQIEHQAVDTGKTLGCWSLSYLFFMPKGRDMSVLLVTGMETPDGELVYVEIRMTRALPGVKNTF